MPFIGKSKDSKQIRAAGFVLYRRGENRLAYLTLRNRRHGDIGFPKGHAKRGEDDLATALRETREETGLDVEPNAWFRTEIRYPVAGRDKTVVYFVARTDAADIRRSKEHDAHAWLDLDAAVAAVRHENLRRVLREAGTFLKDPILRGRLSPADARVLAESRLDDRVVAHTALVAGMARRLAEPLDGIDAAFVEACAWLHDIGRAVDHGRHPLEGFRLVVAAGWPGYAAPCISHYTKGRPHDACGPMADELWRACDLSTFPIEERLVALADFCAARDERVTIEARHADLTARYGRSAFIDESLRIARALKEEVETRTGRSLYSLLGIG